MSPIMTKEQMKTWIDGASYEQLLARWRNAPIGSTWFQGDIGEHYEHVMRVKRSLIGEAAHVEASKSIGW